MSRRFEEGFWTGIIISELFGRNDQSQQGDDGWDFIISAAMFLMGIILVWQLAARYPLVRALVFFVFVCSFLKCRAEKGLISATFCYLLPGTFIGVPYILSYCWCPPWVNQMLDKQFGKTIFIGMVILSVLLELFYQVVAFFGRRRERKAALIKEWESNTNQPTNKKI